MLNNRFFRIFVRMAVLTICVCTVLRVILLFNEQTSDLNFSFMQWVSIFFLGALNDILVFCVGYVFLWLYLLSLTDKKYSSPFGYIILGLLVLAFLYVTCFNTIFDEYGSVAPKIARIVLGYWAGSFALRLFVKRIRSFWSKFWFAVLLVVYVGVIYFNAVSEYYFWNEFGVRYNFIAVDYLVYTNEVIGNIMESYPIIPLASVLMLLTLLTTWLMFRDDIRACEEFKVKRWKLVSSLLFCGMFGGSLLLLPYTSELNKGNNVYCNELQANGAYKFYEAFMHNQLDFVKFYKTLPTDEADSFIYSEYSSKENNHHYIESGSKELYKNIVLITVESMSATYMHRYGEEEGLTPYLDSLCGKSLVFDNVFATGNRTVRGLEALTLSLPPCPGQSIIKQPNNGNLHSTGEMLSKKGYDVLYFYGGNSYFDNMETFFGGNGYEIVDKKSFSPDEITFQNIWGVCDEDTYNKALKVLDERYASKKPFFAHVMSVSNHRPFTYPSGKISIPSDSKSRAGGIMYSDYALGKFLENASTKPWFSNTVFVITADHCASSSGNTELPLKKYRIPAMIYAPGFIQPGSVAKLASQIDIMPTLFSMLGFSYDSWFYGKDIMSDEFKERAFVATYQSLGYIENGFLTVISPIKVASQFKIIPDKEDMYALESVPEIDTNLLFKTIAYYQTSAQWNKR